MGISIIPKILKLFISGKEVAIENPIPVSAWNTNELLIAILTELKKIEYHLFLASDTELKDQDV